MRPVRGPRRRAAGFSLLELMVVIVIMAMAAAGTTIAIGALTRSKLRSACMTVVAASRFAYNRSVSQGTTVRLRFDLETGTMEVQEAHGDVTLARADDAIRRELDESEEEQAAQDPWSTARERMENTLEPSFGRSPFAAITDPQGRTIQRYEPNPLGDGIAVVRLITPHEPEPRTRGKGAIYFFPGGYTQHAVVQLENPSGEVFSVEVMPLTGRAKVHAFAYEPSRLSAEDEIRDPG